MKARENNIAFIDGQNLHLGTSERDNQPYKVDLARFRVILRDKYHIETAYYHLGFVMTGESYDEIYEDIQKAGFILVFREHNSALASQKNGNVDTDIVFSVMSKVYEKLKSGKVRFDKILLVSGDGDYIRLVDFLVKERLFLKVLFPKPERASSFYKKLGSEFCGSMDDIRSKIAK